MLVNGDLLLDKLNRTSIIIVIEKSSIPGVNSFFVLHVTGILKGITLKLDAGWILERYSIEQRLFE